MEKIDQKKNFSKFVYIWAGQFVSILGSGISAFGLSVWIYYETGCATPFAISFLCNILPGIFFAPFAGSFADRKSRKKIMIISDSLDACLKIIMAVLLFFGQLRVWMVYPILFFSSTFSTFQGPAYSACIPSMVPPQMLTKANGLIQFSSAAQSMISPALAGVLYPMLGLKGLIIIDFMTYFVGVVIVALSSIPKTVVEETEQSGMKLVLADFVESVKIINTVKGFMQMVFVFSFLNFVANIAMILVGPMVLSNYSSIEYGYVETIYALSMLIGSMIVAVIPNCKNMACRMFAVLSVSGVGLIISGANNNWIIISIGMFVFFFFVPYANSLFQTYFQTAFDNNCLGRVGALLSAILKIASPLACIFAGPVIDYCFEPLMQENGVLGKSFVSHIIGYGPGRGCGLMFMICGIVLTITCLYMSIKHFRNQVI